MAPTWQAGAGLSSEGLWPAYHPEGGEYQNQASLYAVRRSVKMADATGEGLSLERQTGFEPASPG